LGGFVGSPGRSSWGNKDRRIPARNIVVPEDSTAKTDVLPKLKERAEKAKEND